MARTRGRARLILRIGTPARGLEAQHERSGRFCSKLGGRHAASGAGPGSVAAHRPSCEGSHLSESDEAVQGLRERLSTAGEEALGEVTQALLENPLFNQVLAT